MTQQKIIAVRAAAAILDLRRIRNQQMSQHEELLTRIDCLIEELQSIQKKVKELK